jgi:hypothetical protein
VLHTHLPGEGSARAYGKLGQGHDFTLQLLHIIHVIWKKNGGALDNRSGLRYTVSMSLLFGQLCLIHIILMRPQECKTLGEACCTGTPKLTCCFPAQLFCARRKRAGYKHVFICFYVPFVLQGISFRGSDIRLAPRTFEEHSFYSVVYQGAANSTAGSIRKTVLFCHRCHT